MHILVWLSSCASAGNCLNKEIVVVVSAVPPMCSLLLGIPIKSTLDNASTVQYAGNIHQLLMKARGIVRDIDPQNDLTFLRIRSKKNEIMIAPGNKKCTCAMLLSAVVLKQGASANLHYYIIIIITVINNIRCRQLLFSYI